MTWPWRRGRTDAEDDEHESAPTTADSSPEDLDVGAVHRSVVAPDDLEETVSGVRLGDRWARTLWMGEFPDAPTDGFLEGVYSAVETRETDVSIHLTPRDTQATLHALENQIETLEADYDYLSERHRAGARGVRTDLEDYRGLYDTLRNSPVRPFDVSMYLTTRSRGEEPETDGVASMARRAPANLTPIHPRWAQLDAYTSGSPIAVDAFSDGVDATTPMLSGAVGAMFPFVAGAFAEPGIEYGTYALTESPLILDRFARDTGYCTMVIGTLGAGKSFSTKLQLLRRAMYDPDTIIVMLDPLQGFRSVNDALGGERVTIGGTRGLNPLELRPTPPEVLAAAGDVDPWSEQITWVLSFFATFFEHVATNPLEERRQTLRRAVQLTYERAGITSDPATHANPSPTITDLLSVLEALLDDPEQYGYPTAGEQASVRADAQSLLTDLRPSFGPAGDLRNLAQPTELALDANVLYLDLHQEEGVRGHETSLTMQVLFNAVYERAKETTKRVVFVIDEAHYLMRDATSLEFLETAVRHSRHYDLSLHFITQTGGEFALTPEARTIADLCSLVLIHRVNEEAEKLREWFDLSEREVAWARSAKAGNDADGYSEALLGIDGDGWFPIRVRASDYERRVLEDTRERQTSLVDDDAERARAAGHGRER
ncbi:transfer complex protein (plasmid) [Halarchaeum sp. CBA1220]|uniref:VirB4 family type IV secretion system protein n=1 Tax=Halarchaeum sp. CBA1220 TaxID=1853682 RepID=UPI0015A00DAA|nr:transfer complex protein [Halarchaeum sp. CBA1220]QLC35097.1 transfer complex protein [Halarchaeum sp. CBA1220]